MTDEPFPTESLERILTAVETIEASIGTLARKQSVDLETYYADTDTQDIVERRFVKMTEAAIDIGEVLVKHERGAPPASNPKSMRALEQLGVLSGPTAEEMAQAARFRNVLAHTYGDIIDHDMVYDALQDLERYRRFILEVRDYLESIGALKEHGNDR
ncbi:type VII toxin-antitoxin system HepT family RNase toxin [Natronorubrum tibetense]|uniref:DUF86 domain-containing protein n=1 Tax=Natronorubrum tibetense GA33 TaxID=1114856 RepID=L9VKH2_9EURY|nr:HepT-like ribonuclease domain-containing protein [Natronorubrum tibetense]ELY37710.1 hypothetical protein C496_19420 [Natronorubrum tibetense GA33]